MMNNCILLRYGEIHLKGKNRGFFENILIENIKRALAGINFSFEKIPGRYIISGFENSQKDLIIDKLLHVPGLHSFSPAAEIVTDMQQILKVSEELMKNIKGTFKVVTNRADKTFPLNSMQFSAELGGYLLENNPNLKVDVHNPNFVLNIDIRETGKTFIFFKIIKAIDGMPVGASGKGLLMLSGGIDSPVAGYLMCKRGVKLSAIHFHSFPYTSEQSKEKMFDLARVLARYNGDTEVYVVPFTAIQEAIHANCDPDYLITIIRRFMYRIAEIVSKENKYSMIITGESLAQVASQTIESISVISSVITDTPVLRPLIAFDKKETIDIAVKIKTYDISIKPFEDCCTVFLPENPVTRPKIKRVLREERKLDTELLIQECVKNIEKIIIKKD